MLIKGSASSVFGALKYPIVINPYGADRNYCDLSIHSPKCTKYIEHTSCHTLVPAVTKFAIQIEVVITAAEHFITPFINCLRSVPAKCNYFLDVNTCSTMYKNCVCPQKRRNFYIMSIEHFSVEKLSSEIHALIRHFYKHTWRFAFECFISLKSLNGGSYRTVLN